MVGVAAELPPPLAVVAVAVAAVAAAVVAVGVVSAPPPVVVVSPQAASASTATTPRMIANFRIAVFFPSTRLGAGPLRGPPRECCFACQSYGLPLQWSSRGRRLTRMRLPD